MKFDLVYTDVVFVAKAIMCDLAAYNIQAFIVECVTKILFLFLN